MATGPKAVLITASTKRLGFAFAKASLDMGLSVVAHYRSDRGELGKWVKKNPNLRDRVHFLQAELDGNPASLVRHARSLPLRIVGLVNNASVFAKGNILDAGHFQKVLATNALVPMGLAAEFYRRCHRGWIINITDAHIETPSLAYQNYRTSKLFLSELTRQMAFAFAPNVRVNAIAPGAVLPPKGASRSYLRRLSRDFPLRRPPALDALAQAYAYLATNESVTGQVLYVDCGWHLIG